jgi:hypothetical protein
MNVMSWNSRGLGQTATVQELACLVRKFCPKIVFITETRQQKERVTNLCGRIGLKNALVVDVQGKGGGLVLYWDESIKINVLSYGMHYFDTLVWDGDHHASWRGTFVYGESRTQDRHLMWEALRRLKPISASPWLLIGDFNEVLWSFEQFSARKRPERQMADFLEILAFCDVFDIGFSRVPWTFESRQHGDKNVKIRLDRVVASASWSNWFLEARLHHLVSSRSDHTPILLEMSIDESEKRPVRIAHYEIM